MGARAQWRRSERGGCFLRWSGHSIIGLLAPWLVACTLATDGASLSEGCEEGTKECDGTCVSTSDDRFGCARASCSPCSLHQSVNGCNAEGECAIASCVGSWEDCDRDPTNGCEVDLDNTAESCGGCDDACDVPMHGEAACAEAQCYVRSCDGAYFDCNYDVRDGCEVNLYSDAENCGECSASCGSDEECVEGHCEVTR